MEALYVASDAEGAGKTALCAALAHLLARRGVRAAVRKPLAARGTPAADDADPQAYASLLGQPAGSPLDAPAGGLTSQDTAAVRAAVEGADADLVIVEGSSAVSPRDVRALADAIDARVLVVGRLLATPARRLPRLARRPGKSAPPAALPTPSRATPSLPPSPRSARWTCPCLA